uniref:Uncharacterized protein n=1 Tax=Meloidogyne incognita TaxID=6306 RepID=A0A914MD21_MELIC
MKRKYRGGWVVGQNKVEQIKVTTKYPIGHPKVHILNKDVYWTTSTDNKFELSILKVFVIPPKKIDVAVLPMKLDGDERLLFTLCAACARKYPTGDVLPNYNCSHTDLQRGWVSTCTSFELNVALDEGYVVTKLFRVLEYINSDDKLFAPYISEFMAQKIHSSGFDSSIKGSEEKETKVKRKRRNSSMSARSFWNQHQQEQNGCEQRQEDTIKINAQ